MVKRERPYQHDSTASRLLSEAKHVRAWLVLRWGTTLESQVLFSFFIIFCLYFYFYNFLLLIGRASFFRSSPSCSFSSINNPPYSIILSLATTWLDSNRNNSKNNCTHSTLPNRSEKGDHYYLFTECGIVIINCSSFLFFNNTNDEQFYM